jgi:phosphate-selective porin
MLKRAIEVSGTEEGAATEESPEASTTLAGIEESEVEEAVTDSVDSTPTLLGLGSFLSCLGADDTSSETVVAVTETAGTVESAEVAEVDLDVLTI